MIFKFNWIDALIIIALGRSFYVGLKDGLSAEIVRLVKNIGALILGLHYYQSLGRLMHFNSLYTIAVANTLSFTIIIILLYILFYLIEKFVKAILHFAFIDSVEKYGGLICGGLRSAIAICTILFMFSLIPVNFIVRQVSRHSYAGKEILKRLPVWQTKYIENHFKPKRFKIEDYYKYLNAYSGKRPPKTKA